jgi:hypothetical protein
MSTFELQTFQAGKWNVDSYFDDRELAMSEAEKLDVSGRHTGVRILQEDFDEDSTRSRVRVIFSRMKGGGNVDDDWRVKVQRQSQRTSGMRGSEDAGTRGRRHQRQPKKKSNLYLVISIAIVILLAGVAAMIGLQEFAKSL